MASSQSSTDGQLAKTDLIDEGTNRILSEIYPFWILLAIGLTGIGAFVITGFLGYPNDQGFAALFFFHKPAALFGWFCALIFLLQIAILRDASLRPQRNATLLVTAISILLVAAIDLNLIDLRHLQLPGGLLARITSFLGKGIPYAVVNYGLLALFMVDIGRRWIARAHNRPITLQVDLGLKTKASRAAAAAEADKETGGTADLPAMEDLVSGDLIALGVLSLVLSFIFTPIIVNWFNSLISVGKQPLGACPSPFVYGPCTVPDQGFFGVPSLSFFDLALAFVALFIGLLVLALAAIIVAVRKGGGTQVVVREVLSALRTALNRRTRIAFSSLLLTLRQVVWPVLIFIGVAGAGLAADYTQHYLQTVSNNSACHKVQAFFDAACNLSQIGSGSPELLITVVSSVVAGLGICVAVAILLTQMRIATNSLHFIWQVIKDFAISFWIFSLGVSAINGFIWLMARAFAPTGVVRGPFPQPSLTTIVSFILFVIVAVRTPRGANVEGQATPFIPILGPLTAGRKGSPAQGTPTPS
jgi:hypothetical protein